MVQWDYTQPRHQQDSYYTPITILTTNVIALPATQTFVLPMGVIRKALIVFPRGCNHNISAQIFHGTTQWLPADTGDVLIGENEIFEFPVYRNVVNGNTTFTLKAWNGGGVYWNHTLRTYITVENSGIL
jgi:hypothetical protein